MRTHPMYVVVFACLATVCPGCSGSGHPETAPTSGTVMYQGKPVDGATIAFSPIASGGQVATAITDAEGKYALHTFAEADGAVPGDYKVTISKVVAEDASGGKTPEQIAEENAAKQSRGEPIPLPVVKHLVPAKYATSQTTPELKSVKAGETNVIDFQLSD